MIIGICRIELYIPESNSLKMKRRVVKSLKDRVMKKFNVAIAEIDFQNRWQRALLGVVTLSSEKKQVELVLSEVISFIERTDLAIIAQYQIETC